MHQRAHVSRDLDLGHSLVEKRHTILTYFDRLAEQKKISIAEVFLNLTGWSTCLRETRTIVYLTCKVLFA